MRDAPIGVFDSGVGGLTVLRALIEEMPGEHFIYLGDTARLPYGTKSPQTIVRYSIRSAELLRSAGAKCVVVACNTASGVALEAIRDHVKPLRVIGVIEAGAEAACRISGSGRIAIIGTEGTMRAGTYERAIRRIRPDSQISVRATPVFVALAEEGLCDGPIAEGVAHHYLDPMFSTLTETRPDTLVLGCTHFPILIPAIRSVIGPDVAIVDSAHTTAKTVRAELEAADMLHAGIRGGVRFLATDSPERFARVGSRFLRTPIDESEVELVDL